MKVLVLVAPGSEEMETVAVVDILVRAQIEVALISCCPQGQCLIRASRGVQLLADGHIDTLADDVFDCIVVPGGVLGSEIIGQSARAIALLQQQAKAGRWRAALCAAPVLVLQNNDLIGAATLTAHPHFWPQLPPAQLLRDRVVIDHPHRLLTSQGPGTAIEFALAIVTALRGAKVAAQVAVPMVL